MFNGEKMVVYGVLKQKGTPGQATQVSSSAVLKGSILGKAIEHSVSFRCLHTAPMEEASTLPSIHHLAGKALISDWQDESRNKEEIVKLSVDSSVISSHTAFIAVDEESNEPVTGAMKTWDIQAELFEVEENFRCLRSQFISTNQQLDCLSAPRAKRGGGFLSSIGSAVSGLFSRSRVAIKAHPKLEGAVVGAYQRSYQRSDSFNSSDEDEEDDNTPSEMFEGAEFSKELPTRNAVTPPSSQLTQPTVGLSSFITAQQADGSWKLDTSLAQLMGKNQKDLEEACPTECKGTMAMVWATILVLSLLRMKYSSQQEEWELVAMKAESWVKRQTLPPGVSLEDLYKATEKII